MVILSLYGRNVRLKNQLRVEKDRSPGKVEQESKTSDLSSELNKLRKDFTRFKQYATNNFMKRDHNAGTLPLPVEENSEKLADSVPVKGLKQSSLQLTQTIHKTHLGQNHEIPQYSL